MKIQTLLSILCLGGAAIAQTIQISAQGKSDYVIVTPDRPAPVIKNAAEELAGCLKEVIGQSIPVYAEADRPADRPAFIIGAAKAAAAVFADPEFKQAKPDEIAIKFNGKDIYLNGQQPRGPLYAVYTFLEDYVGVCWWTQDDTDYPHKPTLVVDAKDHAYAPKIICRETFYKGALTAELAPHLKCNGHFARIDAAHGGHRSIIGWCHTFYQFLPPDKYFDAHPEWYSEIKGKRQNGRYQLCLTNEEMRKEFVKVALQQIRKNPSAGMISISQNDWYGRCECAKCKAIEEAEGSPSGLLIRFVNAVAADIAKEYPDFLMETLAYQYTRKAPKITHPAKNVVVRLCSVEMNFAQPLETGPANASFRQDIEDWSKIAPNLFIWNYVTNFSYYMLLQPNYRGLAPDIRFFANHNSIGLFEQGDAGCWLGDFVRLRQWVIGHLEWNPYQDEMVLVRKFLNGYYGAAGPHLLNYLNFLCDAVEKSEYYLRCFNENVYGWLNPEQLTEAIGLYAKAEDAVKDNPVLAARVRRERLSLDFVRLMYAKDMFRASRFLAQQNTVDFDGLLKLADEFIAMTENAGQYRLGVPFGDYARELKKSLQSLGGINGFVPESCKNLPGNAWDVFPVGDFYLHGIGNWAKIVPDDAAAQKQTIWMPGNHGQWAPQMLLPVQYYDESKQWKLVLNVRCEGDADDGRALEYGIYANGLYPVRDTVSIAKCKGSRYVRIESKPFSLKGLRGKSPYLWFAPAGRPLSELKAVYIDEAIIMQAE